MMCRKRTSERYSIPAVDLLRFVPRWECHVHTRYGDGEAAVETMVKKAVEKKMDRIIFTEHTEPWHASDENWFESYMSDIRMARQRFGHRIDIVAGLEAPAIDFQQGLQLTETMKMAVDFVIGSAHRYPGIGHRRVRDLTAEEFIDCEYRTLMALAANPDIDAIGHIGGTCKKYCCDFPVDFTKDVIRQATSHGIAIEINARYHQPYENIIQCCLAADARVTVASDAHRTDDIGIAFKSLQTFFKR